MIIIMLELTIIMYKHTLFRNQIEMGLYCVSLHLLPTLLSVMMATELLQDPGRPNNVLVDDVEICQKCSGTALLLCVALLHKLLQ
jgi:hypothetical protein